MLYHSSLRMAIQEKNRLPLLSVILLYRHVNRNSLKNECSCKQGWKPEESSRESEKTLSQNIYERGVDEAGFGRIRSKGDEALFGGNTTLTMKELFGITQTRPLADFLPTLTIAAKNLAIEMTNHNVQQENLYGEQTITWRTYSEQPKRP